jgi:hypothetical protein
MTAGELGGIPPLAPSGEPELAGRFLEALFRRCDFLRFSGAVIRKEDLLSLLNGIKSFGAALDGALKARGQKAGSGAAGDLGESA